MHADSYMCDMYLETIASINHCFFKVKIYLEITKILHL